MKNRLAKNRLANAASQLQRIGNRERFPLTQDRIMNRSCNGCKIASNWLGRLFDLYDGDWSFTSKLKWQRGMKARCLGEFRSGLQVADALIAATARENGEILATGNVRHFRPVPGLRLKTFRPNAA